MGGSSRPDGSADGDGSGPTLVVWDSDLAAYGFGRTHPLNSVRLELTMDLAARTGVLAGPNVAVQPGRLATDELIELVHDPAYIQAVRRAPQYAARGLAAMFGLGTPDNPVFESMHTAAARITGATLAAAAGVWTGRHGHAVAPAGGLHHAMRVAASGFCIYNDPAVAIAWLLHNGAARVAYVDVDVHHGDGVQAAFYDDPRVLTISLHQSGRTLFPGTGFPDESGAGEACGMSVNVALPPRTGDAGWLRAFSGVVPVLLRAFAPEILVTQHGCDTHFLDPLGDLTLSVEGQRASYQTLHDLAHEVCGGRWVACGGGGYALASVVPRAWTHLLAIAGHVPLDCSRPVPDDWRHTADARVRAATGAALTGGSVPERFGDGVDIAFHPWDAGEGDPDDPLDRAVAATRREILPLHGLDPLVDR
ncbi:MULTISPECIES: acetoin utilization protein AcuC [unclassified Frankia]|uniref:acetoin utilization protein AcuC n=1 Tax=unclassified Frankia TaxID=2632575 RepID=UPI002AD29833|nr:MULTISPECIES: acetoin utilization protein AcuC [unclassified Frankia]